METRIIKVTEWANLDADPVNCPQGHTSIERGAKATGSGYWCSECQVRYVYEIILSRSAVTYHKSRKHETSVYSEDSLCVAICPTAAMADKVRDALNDSETPDTKRLDWLEAHLTQIQEMPIKVNGVRLYGFWCHGRLLYENLPLREVIDLARDHETSPPSSLVENAVEAIKRYAELEPVEGGIAKLVNDDNQHSLGVNRSLCAKCGAPDGECYHTLATLPRQGKTENADYDRGYVDGYHEAAEDWLRTGHWDNRQNERFIGDGGSAETLSGEDVRRRARLDKMVEGLK